MLRRLVSTLAALAFGAALVPVLAAAQEYPPPPPPQQQQQGPPPQEQGPPQYSQRPDSSAYHLSGVVSYFQPYFLVIDSQGRRVPVHLHVGTVILPTGLTLQPGMLIGINGYWVRGYYDRASFVADRIVLLR